MYIKRNLEDTILKYLDSPEIIAIVGPRQCGKTTMVNQLMKNLEKAISISFEDPNILGLFERKPADFIAAYVKGNQYLFIDEFQYAKAGGKILKYIFDTQKIKIIISGSSVLDLTVKAVKYLVGRILVFNLYPFNFQEFLLAWDKDYFKLYNTYKRQFSFYQAKKMAIPDIIHSKFLLYYEDYLLFGGYPRVVLEESREAKRQLLRNIYNTYFLREVRDILGLIDDYKLSNLIKALALQIGNRVKYDELARMSDYSYLSLKKYLNFLDKTYICHFLRPFYKNKGTEIVKNPKVYFFDTGLRNIIIDDFCRLNDRTDKGALLENGLAMQFSKSELSFNFWRDKKKNELDFIISLGNKKIIAVESKSYLKNILIPTLKVFKNSYPDIDIYFSYFDVDKNLNQKLENIYPVYLY